MSLHAGCLDRLRAGSEEKGRGDVRGLREALQVALVELSRAPCRDNAEHTHCLKCAAVWKVDAAIDASHTRTESAPLVAAGAKGDDR